MCEYVDRRPTNILIESGTIDQATNYKLLVSRPGDCGETMKCMIVVVVVTTAYIIFGIVSYNNR